MALRFMDSFDHYTFAQMGLKYDFLGAYGAITTGRNGTSGYLSGYTNGGGSLLIKVFDAQPTWIMGVAFKVNTYATQGIPSPVVFEVRDSASVIHMSVSINNASHLLQIARGGSIISTGTTAINIGQFYYIEAKFTIADSGGVAIINLNGITEINFSGDTRNGGNATADRVYVGTVGGDQYEDCTKDDLYICDGVDQSIAETGSLPNNDFLGDIRVQALLPNGDGLTSNFLGSDGNSTNNYLLVDESTPNGDTDYVESNVVSDKDTYAMSNLTPTLGTVYGSQILSYIRKTDAGSRTVKSVLGISGTEVDGPTQSVLNTYSYLSSIRGTKPGGGSWTIADINAVEAGIKIIS